MLNQLISNSNRRLFLTLIIFHLGYLWFVSFSHSVLNPHFLNEGLTIAQIVIGYILAFLAGGIATLVMNQMWSKIAWRLAFIFNLLFILLIINISSVSWFYFASFISGLPIAFFYTTYNIAHFKLTPKTRTSYSSAILFSLNPIISLVAPLVAGLLAELSFNWVWALTLVFFAVGFYLSRFQQNFRILYKPAKDWHFIKAMRGFLVLQGLWETLIFVIIPTFGLYFISTPLKYGSYLAYLALVGIIANLLLGHISDRKQKRLVFIYPIIFLMAMTAFFTPLAINSLTLWLIVTGTLQFLMPLFHNLTTSIWMDAYPDGQKTFAIREMVLNLSRVVGVVLLAANFYFEARPTYIFYFLAAAILAYAVLLFYQTRISRRYSYL